MEKHDDDDYLDTMQSNGIALKQYNTFPGFFTKQLLSTDNIVSFTRMFSIVANGFSSSDSVYGVTDTVTGDSYTYISLSTNVITIDPKYINYAINYDMYRLLGFKIEAMAVCTDSPLSGTFFSRIQYPPLHIASFYTPNQVVGPLLSKDLISAETHFVVPSDGSVVTKSILYNDLRQSGLYQSLSGGALSLFVSIFCNGFVLVPVVDPSLSEAYQVQVTAIVAFKNYTQNNI